MIGYACVSKKNTLFNFYIAPKYLLSGTAVLEKFIKQREIKKAEVATNNPICLSMIMHLQKSIEIDSYLFKDMEEVNQKERDVEFRLAEPDEQERLVNFTIRAHELSEQSKTSLDGWRNYYGDVVSKGVIFVIEKKDEIIGLLEVRTSNLRTKKTSLGVVVENQLRNQEIQKQFVLVI